MLGTCIENEHVIYLMLIHFGIKHAKSGNTGGADIEQAPSIQQHKNTSHWMTILNNSSIIETGGSTTNELWVHILNQIPSYSVVFDDMTQLFWLTTLHTWVIWIICQSTHDFRFTYLLWLTKTQIPSEENLNWSLRFCWLQKQCNGVVLLYTHLDGPYLVHCCKQELSVDLAFCFPGRWDSRGPFELVSVHEWLGDFPAMFENTFEAILEDHRGSAQFV